MVLSRNRRSFESPHFFKKFNERKRQIGYIHQSDFFSDFFSAFDNPDQSLILPDIRPDSENRHSDCYCLFKGSNGKVIFVPLKSQGDYYEVLNVMCANKWAVDFFENKDAVRKIMAEYLRGEKQ